MTLHELGLISGLTIWLTWLFYGFGQVVLRLFQVDDRRSLFWVGVSILLGVGFFGYGILLMGVAKLITTPAVVTVLVICTVALIKSTWVTSQSLLRTLVIFYRKQGHDRIALAMVIVIFVLAGVHFLATFAPPTGRDEIGYHLPEALNVLQNKQVVFPLGGHLFYGNIPVLMEIIFAGAIALGGYTLAHMLHYLIFLAFLWSVGAILNRLYGLKTGLLAILLLFLNSALARTALTGFIDTAVISYELGALIYFLYWVNKKELSALSVSALLLGFALSLKYSPAFTAGYIGLIFMIILASRLKNLGQWLYQVARYSLIVLLIGGFWYLKNFSHYGNPFYPLYFGHRGYSDQDYVGLINAIQDFVVPRTFHNFIIIPERLFLSTNNLPIFLAFYMAPLTLFIHKRRDFAFALIVFYLTYSAYWFFFATHQVRFLTPATVAATIAMAIVLTNYRRKLLVGLVAVIIGSLLWINQSVKPILSPQAFTNYLQEVIKADWLSYGLGRETKGEFLAHQFGCQVEVLQYLEEKDLKGAVIDNWSVWHDPSVSFFAQKNPVIVGPLDVPIAELPNLIARYGFRFIYYKDATKKQFLLDTDPAIVAYREKRINQESFLLNQSHQIFEKDGCRLFLINDPLAS